MNPQEIRNTFIDFYRERCHHLIGSSSLVPPDPEDPVLLVTSGMHPLTGYLEGEPHPLGTRLVSQQRCLRTTDLDEVGDDSHLTLFEMQGSWSLGDYSHERSLRWGFELVTDVLGVPVEDLSVTVFGGSDETPPDEDSERVWRDLGIPDERITRLVEDNWWSNGPTGLCGPDSEMFVHTNSGWMELWNHVSMTYWRDDSGRLQPLSRRNVDTGMGFERLVRVLEGVNSVWETSLLRPWVESLGPVWGLDGRSLRTVSDHLRSSIVLIGDGVRPGNSGRGYVLRRLLRRSLRLLRQSSPNGTLRQLPLELVTGTLGWFELTTEPGEVRRLLLDEERRYLSSLERGRQEITRLLRRGGISDDDYRWLWETHGLPSEIVDEVLG